MKEHLAQIGEGPRDFKVHPIEDDVFPLEKLPVELRIKVYEGVLTEPPTIFVQRREKRLRFGYESTSTKISGTADKKSSPHYLPAKHQPKAGHRDQKAWYNFSTGQRTAILCVSKAIHKEAIEVLYGQNHFTFTSTAVFHQFMRAIGNKAGFLTELSIQNFGCTCKLHELPRLTSLRRLELTLIKSWLYVNKNIVVEQMRKRFLDSFSELKKCSCAEKPFCGCKGHLVLDIVGITERIDTGKVDRAGFEAALVIVWAGP